MGVLVSGSGLQGNTTKRLKTRTGAYNGNVANATTHVVLNVTGKGWLRQVSGWASHGGAQGLFLEIVVDGVVQYSIDSCYLGGAYGIIGTAPVEVNQSLNGLSKVPDANSVAFSFPHDVGFETSIKVQIRNNGTAAKSVNYHARAEVE